jgi:hypothetical protein
MGSTGPIGEMIGFRLGGGQDGVFAVAMGRRLRFRRVLGRARVGDDCHCVAGIEKKVEAHAKC